MNPGYLRLYSSQSFALQVSKIPEDALSAITAQVLQGLSYLHRYKHTVSPTFSSVRQSDAQLMGPVWGLSENSTLDEGVKHLKGMRAAKIGLEYI